jgi:hypothetical protein
MGSGVASASALAEEGRLVSNAGRVMILSYLKGHGEASWSQIQKFLIDQIGAINPNTLQFHMKVLLHAKWIRRAGSEDAPLYSLGAIPDSVADRLPVFAGADRAGR